MISAIVERATGALSRSAAEAHHDRKQGKVADVEQGRRLSLKGYIAKLTAQRSIFDRAAHSEFP
jgi:hypothetical protein